MSNIAKPAAGDGGSRQCIGSGQNHAAETKATPDTTQGVLPIDQIIVGDSTRRDPRRHRRACHEHRRDRPAESQSASTTTDACWLALESSPRASRLQ